jgi:hypothetical protein
MAAERGGGIHRGRPHPGAAEQPGRLAEGRRLRGRGRDARLAGEHRVRDPEVPLYDIDRIISRTLAYAIVTGLLVGLYAGLVLLATQVFRFHNSVAVAVSTLVAAALFNPVRHRVQHAVDRRFNRASYDADLTVTQFAARLQDAVDISSVHSDLLSTVDRALAPAHLTVWAVTAATARGHSADVG